ncbi:MAG: DoxX family membrane protein [candidate division KSB1 bacterium]|nr:DoxX family membrane protein [candidate division KSB1 bacterium]
MKRKPAPNGKLMNTERLTNLRKLSLVLLRMIIGWHFLYEGVSKILIPDWSAAPYLQQSRWIFADLFHAMAANAQVLQIVDILNMAGLVLIGLALLLGVFSRAAGLFGIAMLLLYYAANPPFIGTDFGVAKEGHYLFINKNVVEMAGLLLIALFPTDSYFGIRRLLTHIQHLSKRHHAPAESFSADRRGVLTHLLTLPVLGGFAYGAVKKYKWEKVNAISGATITVSDSQIKDLKGELPKGKIR